jgi:hypothetical protein
MSHATVPMVAITPMKVNTKIIIACNSVIVTPVLVGGHNIAQVKTATDGKGTSVAVGLGAKALLDGTRRGSDGWNWYQLCILCNHECFIVEVSCGAKERTTSTNCKVQVWAVTLFGTKS